MIKHLQLKSALLRLTCDYNWI